MSRRPPFRIAILCFPDAMSLDIVGPQQILAAVNDERPKNSPGYAIEILAAKKGAIMMSGGLAIVADRSYKTIGPTHWRGIDTLIVAGGRGVVEAMTDPILIDTIRHVAKYARRTVSVCSGAFLLAEAGLLKGKRAATHWGSCDRLKQRYPDIEVEMDAIFVQDGNVWTSAGVTAGMDLALALVEQDFGHEMALKIARRHVLYMIRPGGQSQFSARLAAQGKAGGRLSSMLSWIPEHLGQDLSVSSLAARAAMSERNFARTFREETGETPARFIEQMRLETAKMLLAGSSLPVSTVATRCGFGPPERMRRSFLRELRINPSTYRERFKSTAEK